MPARSKSAAANNSSVNLGFEATDSRGNAFFKFEAIFRTVKAPARHDESGPVRIKAEFCPERADTFRRDLRADYVLPNPLFDDSDWFSKLDEI